VDTDRPRIAPLGDVEVAGEFVAYPIYGLNPQLDTGEYDLVVVDTSGRARGYKEVAYRYRQLVGSDDGDVIVSEFALGAQGDLAWVTSYPVLETPAHTTLSVRDGGGTRILDTGSPGGITQVAIVGDIVSWRNAGVPHSTPLAGA
jgi:hypothetical protein